MIMIFGRQDQFLIEAHHRITFKRRHYGSMRFIIHNQAIGDMDTLIDLTSSAAWARKFLDATHRRTRLDLDNASASEIFGVLYQGRVIQVSELHKYDQNVQIDASSEAWDRDPYLLDDIGESSVRDKYTILAIRRSDGNDRLVIKSYIDGSLRDVIVEQGIVEDSLYKYCTWTDALVDMQD
jgi:hypothetical protein